MLNKECTDINNYYNILDLEYTANTETIRKQYHKNARQWHPDRNHGDDVQFKKIKEAYDVLIDPQKKKMYDLNITPSSENSLNQQENTTFFHSDINFEFDLNDIIGNIFENLREPTKFSAPNKPFSENKPFSAPRKPDKSEDPKTIELLLSIDEVLNGSDKHISYKEEYDCHICKGEGVTYTGLLQCLTCGGRGYIEAFPCPYVCMSCNGDAHIRMNLKKCTSCENGKIISKKTECIHIDSGYPNGTQLSYKHLRIRLKHCFMENTIIDKKGVHIKHFIKIEELLCGFKHIINLSDLNNKETEIILERDGYFDFNEIILIQNKGYICPSKKTRSHVYIQIVIDSKTTKEKEIHKYKRVFDKIFS
jgi:DnaJ-class molecular chaperone